MPRNPPLPLMLLLFVIRAVGIDEDRFMLLKGNTKKAAGSTPGCRRVRFFNAYFLKVLETERETIGAKQPVVFLDPPWGRVHYKKHVRPCLRVYASIHVCA